MVEVVVSKPNFDTGDRGNEPLETLSYPLRLSQQKTCAALVAAPCQAAQASSFAIAGQLSALTEVQLGSALTRLYRFLRNERFDNWLLTERMLHLLAQPNKAVLQQFAFKL